MFTALPDISLIIPVLNEAAVLPGLFDSLAEQEGVNFEVILCNGGSSDSTEQLCHALAEKAGFTVRTIETPRGRGAQMNAGAGIARSDLLLFLHADSRFSKKDALLTAVDAYRTTSGEKNLPVAGRFRLTFRRQSALPSLAYYFYESKACLDRNDCIRGDQGFLLSRALFDRLGGYDTSLPFLEDIRLVTATVGKAHWLLLPAEISTSARRFETEGLYERQVVNAIITNAIATGWTDFFSTLPGLYRCNSVSGRLQLFPLLDGIRTLLAANPVSWRRKFWRETGRHVANNIWQLFFWLDVRSGFRQHCRPENLSTCNLQRFQSSVERFTRGLPAEVITATAVWVWFRFLLIRHRVSTRTS